MRAETPIRPLRANGRNRTFEAAWDVTAAFAGNPDFIAVCAFALIGLLVSICLAILFPLSAETVELLAEFL
jgi:hypothetical protein